VGDRRGEAATLNNIGLAYNSISQPQEALKYFNQALPIWRSVGDRAGEATTLSNIDAVNNRSQPPSRTNIPQTPK
jgi:tetratricopeptide (TPR) repeat protein